MLKLFEGNNAELHYTRLHNNHVISFFQYFILMELLASVQTSNNPASYIKLYADDILLYRQNFLHAYIFCMVVNYHHNKIFNAEGI